MADNASPSARDSRAGSIDRSVLLYPDAGTTLRADVVVVGTGAGGAAVAGALRRQGADVVMIEAGPAEDGVPGHHVVNDGTDHTARTQQSMTELTPHAGAPEPVPGLPGGRAFHGVGGMLTRWAGMVPRPDLHREWDGAIPAPEMSGLLDEAETLIRATPADELLRAPGDGREGKLNRWLLERMWDRFGAPPAAGAARIGRLAAWREPGGTVRYTGADTLLAAGPHAGRLTIIPGHIARKILHSGNRADGVLAYAAGGTGSVRVEADVVVVAAGAIGTPQLLTASGMDTSPALGRYLTDHLMFFFQAFPLKRGEAPPTGRGEPASVVLPPSEERAFQIALLGILAQAGPPAVTGQPQTIGIGVFVGTEPKETSRLAFDPQALDPFGMPKATAHVEISDADHARVGQALGLSYGIAAEIGEPWEGTGMLFGPLGASLHVMGTHRMGTDPGTSVTDPQCRMWEWDNVYLAGNGILGSRNSCNPTLTTVALGLQAAKAIAARA